MEHYGLALPFDEAGFFATEHHRTVVRQTKAGRSRPGAWWR